MYRTPFVGQSQWPALHLETTGNPSFGFAPAVGGIISIAIYRLQRFYWRLASQKRRARPAPLFSRAALHDTCGKQPGIDASLGDLRALAIPASEPRCFMRRHRFLQHTEAIPVPPPPPQPNVNPSAFFLFPSAVPPGMTVEQWMMRQMIYQLAFQQAQAVVRPSLPERDLLAVWN